MGDQRKDIEAAYYYGVIPIATIQCQELAQENNLIQYIFKLKQQEPDALAFVISKISGLLEMHEEVLAAQRQP